MREAISEEHEPAWTRLKEEYGKDTCALNFGKKGEDLCLFFYFNGMLWAISMSSDRGQFKPASKQ
jgi:hypothetical protein